MHLLALPVVELTANKDIVSSELPFKDVLYLVEELVLSHLLLVSRHLQSLHKLHLRLVRLGLEHI